MTVSQEQITAAFVAYRSFTDSQHNSGGHSHLPSCILCQRREHDAFANDPRFVETRFVWVLRSDNN